MQHNSLFNLPKQEKKPEKQTPAPTKAALQTDLFGNSTRRIEAPKKEEAPKRRPAYMPRVGDRVSITSLNGGIEGEITVVDQENIFRDYMYPIQLTIPSLNNMMYRTSLGDLKELTQ